MSDLGASGASTDRALRGFRHGNKKPLEYMGFFIAATA
jgi:hypothetical protein